MLRSIVSGIRTIASTVRNVSACYLGFSPIVESRIMISNVRAPAENSYKCDGRQPARASGSRSSGERISFMPPHHFGRFPPNRFCLTGLRGRTRGSFQGSLDCGHCLFVHIESVPCSFFELLRIRVDPSLLSVDLPLLLLDVCRTGPK